MDKHPLTKTHIWSQTHTSQQRCACTHTWSIVSYSLRPHGLYPPGSSVDGIFQARILEWAIISYSRGSSPTRESNLSLLHLLHWQVDSLPLHFLGNPQQRHRHPQINIHTNTMTQTETDIKIQLPPIYTQHTPHLPIHHTPGRWASVLIHGGHWEGRCRVSPPRSPGWVPGIGIALSLPFPYLGNTSGLHLCPEACRTEPEGKEGIWRDLLGALPWAVCVHAVTALDTA